jgi:DUF1680 family protein
VVFYERNENKYLNIKIASCIVLFCYNSYAQERLYPNTFPLSDVTLLDGPFKHARDLNIKVLLKYDVDRLLASYRKEAGLPAKAAAYSNWEGLDGHIGGHYLSAIAMNYSATKNPECKKRMEYMISELKACQDANSTDQKDWGTGYVGGVPNSKIIWTTLKMETLKHIVKRGYPGTMYIRCMPV